MKIRVAKPSEIPSEWYGETIGFDIESSDKTFEADICMVSVYSPKDDTSLVIGTKVYQKGVLKEIDSDELEILKKFLGSIKAVGHFLQYDLSHVQHKWGVKMSVGFDTFILSRMLQMDTNALKEIYCRLYPEKAEHIFKFKEVLGEAPWSYNIDDPNVVKYSGLDAVLPFRIMDYYTSYINREDTQRILDMEFRFVETSADIRAEGINVDMEKFQRFNEQMKEVYNHKAMEFSKHVGYSFRCNSSADIERELVDKMGLVPPVKTKGGKYSMSTECLEMMADMYDTPDVRSIIEEILELKHLFSVVNSIKKVPQYVGDDMKFHPTVEQIGYDGTSRVYTSDPSVQQFPAEFRDCIVPSKGKKFMYMDWSGAEMYIAAYWGKCEEILRYFNEGLDPHTEVSKRLLGKESVSKDERATSKVVTFATFYGSEGAAVGRALHVDNETGTQLVNKYLEIYPEIATLRSKIVAFAHKHEMTRTMFRRYRKLPKINSTWETEKKKSERQAFNTAIQNSCADFYKAAVNRYKQFTEGEDIRFVIGVFDSLLFEVPEDYTEEQAVAFFEKVSDFSDIFPNFKFHYKWAFGKTWKECSDQT